MKNIYKITLLCANLMHIKCSCNILPYNVPYALISKFHKTAILQQRYPAIRSLYTLNIAIRIYYLVKNLLGLSYEVLHIFVYNQTWYLHSELGARTLDQISTEHIIYVDVFSALSAVLISLLCLLSVICPHIFILIAGCCEIIIAIIELLLIIQTKKSKIDTYRLIIEHISISLVSFLNPSNHFVYLLAIICSRGFLNGIWVGLFLYMMHNNAILCIFLLIYYCIILSDKKLVIATLIQDEYCQNIQLGIKITFDICILIIIYFNFNNALNYNYNIEGIFVIDMIDSAIDCIASNPPPNLKISKDDVDLSILELKKLINLYIA